MCQFSCKEWVVVIGHSVRVSQLGMHWSPRHYMLMAWVIMHTSVVGSQLVSKHLLCVCCRHYWEANMPVGDFLAALFWTLTLRDTVAPFDAFVR